MAVIFTDSCSDLTDFLTSKYNISIIPLTVHINGQEFIDRETITLDELFALVEKYDELPKTAAPSVSDFVTKFKNVDDEIIFIGISSKLSATVQNARSARDLCEKPERIKIVDSLNLSTGIGLLVLHAAELINKGNSANTIENEILDLVPKVRTSFLIDTLDYLYKGGRCSSMENIVGSLLQIRPIIEVKQDGTLNVKEKCRGSRKKALKLLITDFEKRVKDIDLNRVFITHTGCPEDADMLANKLKQIAPINDLIITTAGSTIGSHCGKNTIGILYLLK